MTTIETIHVTIDTHRDRAMVRWKNEHASYAAVVFRDEQGVIDPETLKVSGVVSEPAENALDPIFRHHMVQSLLVEVIDAARDQLGDNELETEIPLNIFDRGAWAAREER